MTVIYGPLLAYITIVFKVTSFCQSYSSSCFRDGSLHQRTVNEQIEEWLAYRRHASVWLL